MSNIIDKTIAYFSPQWALKRSTARIQNQAISKFSDDGNVRYSRGIIRGGNAYKGASNSRSFEDWNPNQGDTNSSILDDLPKLRERSQDLYNNAPAAHGAIRTINTNVIGPGLILRSTPDIEVLNMTDEEGQAWSDTAEREFRLWAESQFCDYTCRMTFTEIQKLVGINQQISGDIFVLLPHYPRKGIVYDLRLQLIDAARVCNPDDAKDTSKIAGGIEYNDDGIPVAIHIRTPHPGSALHVESATWQRVEFFGEKTNRYNVLHVMEHERIDQARGIPILAPVIETLKQISKYAEAEITAAVINALLTVFVKKTPNSGLESIGELDETDEDEEVQARGYAGPQQLGAGTWIEGAEGEELQIINGARPSNQFDPFFIAAMKQIGTGLELPYEVLIKHFSSSYSASRAALLEAWKMFKVRREFIINKLCKPVYQEFITESVAKGRIHAPGFLSDPIIRNAYLKCQWVGPVQGQLDPSKEFEAANKSVVYGYTSRGRVTAETTGLDHDEVLREQAREQKLAKQLGVTLETSQFQPVQQQSNDESEKNQGNQDND